MEDEAMWLNLNRVCFLIRKLIKWRQGAGVERAGFEKKRTRKGILNTSPKFLSKQHLGRMG
jgi:hypothetical protein